MKFVVTIKTENAAFVDEGSGCEVARILRKLAEMVEFDGPRAVVDYSYPLRDINGNRVGKAEFTDD